MRLIRLLAALVILYGLSYFVYGLRQHLGLADSRANRYVATLNLNIGTFSMWFGIGLLLAREWGRVSWLTLVTILLTLHVFLLALTYLTGGDPAQEIFNVVLTLLIFLISWSRLTRPSVKELFR